VRLPTTYKYRIFSLLLATFLLGGCVDENALSSNPANDTDTPIGVVIPGDDTPADPAPVVPDPAPVEPDPAPVEPDPAPVEPDPAPVEPDPVPTTSNATLNWMPPTENTDGSALTDLVEYKIYYGTSPDAMTNEIANISIGLSTYVIENLQTNTTYFFSMTAVNSMGIESSFSNTLSAYIP